MDELLQRGRTSVKISNFCLPREHCDHTSQHFVTCWSNIQCQSIYHCQGTVGLSAVPKQTKRDHMFWTFYLGLVKTSFKYRGLKHSQWQWSWCWILLVTNNLGDYWACKTYRQDTPNTGWFWNQSVSMSLRQNVWRSWGWVQTIVNSYQLNPIPKYIWLDYTFQLL